MLSRNKEEIEDFYEVCDAILAAKDVQMLVNLVVDREQVTMLEHTLVRHQSILERKIKKNMAETDNRQMIEIVKQRIHAAKVHKYFLESKLCNVLDNLVFELGQKIIEEFKMRIENNIKLVITLQEIEDKSKLI